MAGIMRLNHLIFSVFTKKPVMKKRFPNDCRNNQVSKMNLR